MGKRVHTLEGVVIVNPHHIAVKKIFNVPEGEYTYTCTPHHSDGILTGTYYGITTGGLLEVGQNLIYQPYTYEPTKQATSF